jgi:hypothetical protein
VVSLSPSDLSLSVVNPLVAFYDIHGRKREVLFDKKGLFVKDNSTSILRKILLKDRGFEQTKM